MFDPHPNKCFSQIFGDYTQASTQGSKRANQGIPMDKSMQTKGNFLKIEKSMQTKRFGIRFNHLKGWISPQPACFLFHHQSTNQNFELFFYIYIVDLFFYIVDGNERPGFKKGRRRSVYEEMEDKKMEWFRRYQKSGSDTTWYVLNWRITLAGCWIWSEKENDTSGTKMDWKDHQEMQNGSWYTHDLRLTT